jgi:photosystem II stability/assembly factor-like uncharacterized protein
MLISVLVITALATLCVAAQLSFQDVLDTPAMRSDLAAKTLLNGVTLAGKRLISVGWRGHIVYSDNQGKSWTQASVPVSSDLTAVSFPSPQNGWAVGHDGVVLHSSDGGATWVKQFDGRAAAQVMATQHRSWKNCSGCHDKMVPPAGKPKGAADASLMADLKSFTDQGPDKPFLDVWFENDSTGFIVGAFNLIFRTTDGGKIWEPWFDRTENKKRLHLYKIKPVGQDLFICGEQGLVLKLDRVSGRFNALKAQYLGSFFGITGKPGSVVVFGLRGNAFRSLDGGASWQKVETGVQAALTGAAVTEDGRIIMVSQAGQVLVSIDNGASFTQVKVEQPFAASAVAALDNNTLVLAGSRGVQVLPVK